MEKLHSYITRISAVLLCLTLVSFYLLCGMYARYTSEGGGSDSARVAAFVFHVSSTPETNSIPIEQINKPGDKSTYSITIKNNSSGATSEVKESYTIAVSINGSMPLSCTMKKTDSASDLFSINNYSGSESGTALKKTNTEAETRQTFTASTQGTDTYSLVVEWPSDKNNAKYANGSGQAEIVITITGVQED